MRMTLGFEVNVSELRFEPVSGRRTVFAKLTVGSRTFWVQRWDAVRSISSNRRIMVRSFDGLMCWTVGINKI